MLDFFEHVPATDVASHDDADMLLFEFGTYAWNDGRFSTSLTRQLIYADGDDDDISSYGFSISMRPTTV